jgi:pimeloyl-ACP methyl ester carboxylesterase
MTSGTVTCRTSTVPVGLTDTSPKTFRISGVLCATPAELANPGSVQVLVPGGTYNHIYWDFGVINGLDYSYARYIAAHGIPTFNIDPLGTGASSRPLSALVSIETAGNAVHQVIQALRGTPGYSAAPQLPRFDKVILVGHSLGSLTSWSEASRYHDIDALIVTGMIHWLSTKVVTTLGTAFYPALLDPKFLGSVLDPGYLTTFPGNRGQTFYNPATVDPAVVAKDEQTKDVMSTVALDGFLEVVDGATRAVDVPVLVIMGQDDLMCGASPLGVSFSCDAGSVIASQEASQYGPDANVQGCSVAGSGHDLTLSYGVGLEEDAAAAWSMDTVGQHGVRTSSGLPAACGAG